MPRYEQDGKQRNADKRTLGSKRTFHKPPATGFNSSEQKALKDTFPCFIKNPKAQWDIVGEPAVEVSNFLERNEENLLELTIQFKVNGEVLYEGRWIMDEINDLVAPLDPTEILIGDIWEVRGNQAYWVGENSTMFVQNNGDGTFVFITYSDSMFECLEKAKPEETFEAQCSTIQNDV